MMRIATVIALFPNLSEPELTGWIARGWVRPEGAEPDFVFQEIDVARVRLVHDLLHAMALAEDAVSLVLSLLDQVYDLRARLHAVVRAVDQQPEAVRQAISEALDL